jgi:hypothetical protein
VPEFDTSTETVDLEDAEHWFQIDILGVEDPNTPGEDILTNSELIPD